MSSFKATAIIIHHIHIMHNTSNHIRRQFIEFFQSKDHHSVPPSPIVNKQDPQLLFTNAGMNQFKDIFLGQKPPLYPSVVNSQPCLRVSGKHNDLEEVGVDTYHHTMFEMLGNWSFGDYFKEQTIQWAWELLTTIYHLPKERMYVTVFKGDEKERLTMDEETFHIWEQYIHPEHILYGSKKDNFWEMGDKGPCGPSTEIHIDLRSEEERTKLPGKELVNAGHPQVIELWNLVFIQYERTSEGLLHQLKNKYVDTGMGFERLVMVLQNKTSAYDTDIFLPLTENLLAMHAQQEHPTPTNEETPIAIRVIADHIRAITFAIADGQLPSNTQAGYVIRRILRRAVRYGYTYLGFKAPFMHQLIAVLSKQFQYIYPQIINQKSYIEQIVENEESIFFKTLTTGLERLDHIINHLPAGLTTIDGAIAFELYDTYGFPFDLTKLVAAERGIEVDEKGFDQALQLQRDRSQKAAIGTHDDWQVLIDQPSTFVGYDQLQVSTHITQYRKEAKSQPAVYHLVLEQTPFYPEGGGQVGDTGQLIIGDEVIPVLDTKKEFEQIIHYTHQLPSDLNAAVTAKVDSSRRQRISNNHTATHLLHAALKEVLGTHVEQKGSLVTAESLRFDFLHYSKVTTTELATIEKIINQKIRTLINLQEVRQMPLEQAKALGVTALFGEKYGENVRVITFDDHFSKELCGGTHVTNTGQIGCFKIIAESSVAAGTRRIEAVTAEAAEAFCTQQAITLRQVAEILKHPKDVIQTLQQLMDEKATLVKKLQAQQDQTIQATIQHLQQHIQPINGIPTIIEKINIQTVQGLKQVIGSFKNREERLFVTLVATIDQEPHVAVCITPTLLKTSALNASVIVKELSKMMQGGGGGHPFLAMGKGKDTSKLEEVLMAAKGIIQTAL